MIGRDGFLVGAEASYNVQEGKVTKYATAIGYSAPEYAVTLHGLGNLSTFAASYYHRVSPDVEAGAKAVYDTRASPKGNVALEVGAKMYLDNAAFVKAKINNSGILALGTSPFRRHSACVLHCAWTDASYASSRLHPVAPPRCSRLVRSGA